MISEFKQHMAERMYNAYAENLDNPPTWNELSFEQQEYWRNRVGEPKR